MAFTVGIRRGKNKEECNFGNLIVYHKDCGGGKITNKVISVKWDKKKSPFNYIELLCSECGKRVWISVHDTNFPELIERAMVEGKKKSIYHSYAYAVSSFKERSGFFLAKAYSLIEISIIPETTQEQDTNKDQSNSEENHCPYCGGKLMPGGSYCPFCGAKLDERITDIKEVSVNK